MLVGVILNWLQVDMNAVVLHIAFMVWSVNGLIKIFLSKGHNNISQPTVIHAGLYLFVILLVLGHFIFDSNVIGLIAAAAVLQYVLTRYKLSVNKSQQDE